MKLLKNLSKLFFNPFFLLLLWIGFLSLPVLSIIRYYFIIGSSHVSTSVRVLGGLILYLPYLAGLVIVFVFLWWFKELLTRGFTELHKSILKLIMLSSLIFLLISRYLLYLEGKNYPNFLYSKTGILVSQLEFMSTISLLVLIGLISFIFYGLEEKARIKGQRFGGFTAHTKYKHNLNKSFLNFRLPFFIYIILLTWSTYSFLINYRHLADWSVQGYDQKLGSQIKYLFGLRDSTPNDSFVIHPPQGMKWPAIGNQPVIRYFLYPRTLLSGALLNNDGFAKSIGSAYFVEVDPEFNLTHWPIVNEKSKYVIFDEKTKISYEKLQIVSDRNGIKVFQIFF